MGIRLFDRTGRQAILIKPPFELPKDLWAQVIRREPFVLIVPADLEGDDPLLLLANHPHVRYDRNSFGGRLVTRFLREQQIDVQVALELDELEAIVKMVECGQRYSQRTQLIQQLFARCLL